MRLIIPLVCCVLISCGDESQTPQKTQSIEVELRPETIVIDPSKEVAIPSRLIFSGLEFSLAENPEGVEQLEGVLYINPLRVNVSEEINVIVYGREDESFRSKLKLIVSKEERELPPLVSVELIPERMNIFSFEESVVGIEDIYLKEYFPVYLDNYGIAVEKLSGDRISIYSGFAGTPVKTNYWIKTESGEFLSGELELYFTSP